MGLGSHGSAYVISPTVRSRCDVMFSCVVPRNNEAINVITLKTPDDGKRNCPKHVELYSKNKFEKLVHLVGFIIRIYHDARSPERQKYLLGYDL